MNPFDLVSPTRLRDVAELLADGKGQILAGGTDLLDRLKERIDQPERVVNIKGLKELYGITNGVGLSLGALTTIADIAADDRVRKQYPALAEAALAVGTPQLRNMGTLGGNLCQRPRCWYYRSNDYPCLKKGGFTCYAVTGRNKYHAIFGGGPSFIVHPSDAAPALIALGATLEIHGAHGERMVPLAEFFQGPRENLLNENALQRDELIARVHLPMAKKRTRSTFLKFREKLSLDFAVSSVAVALDMDGDTVRDGRIVLGGVAPIPWNVPAAVQQLQGRKLSSAIDDAAEAAVDGARPLDENGFKVTLTRNLLRRALQQLA
ncbi:MAG: xanthine dehydrogenase family protein subunit M [Gemmatimonadetes bacterium]|jgi:xanthine dehydrogenase YagS FAD-binding subunit|nr:xanthine dehydrogenase family protein subunit M [Gemmatimonadota bacterium]